MHVKCSGHPINATSIDAIRTNLTQQPVKINPYTLK